MLKKPFIIAEIGVNHECDLTRAFKLVDLAVKSGADAAKFQTYKAVDLARKDSPAYWDLSEEKTRTQRELFNKYDCFNLDDYEKLYEHCRNVGIEFMSTPFSAEAFEWIDPLVKRHKLSSSDMTNTVLIERMISSKKPIIASTGAANIEEIDELVRTFSVVNDFSLLHCILSYPTKIEDANLASIPFFIDRYPAVNIGYSDHLTSDYLHALFSAYVLGAKIIETHFTDNKKSSGNDHYHALDARDLSLLVNWCNDFQISYGKARNDFYSCEKKSRIQARRSVTAKTFIRAGEKITSSHLTLKRPGDGLHPKKMKELIGVLAPENLNEDELIPSSWIS